MNSQQNPVRVEEPSQFATNGKASLSRIEPDDTSIVPSDTPMALPEDARTYALHRAPARWPLFVIALGLFVSLGWSLGLAWLVGLLFGVL